ncbi:YkvA family protein [Pseudomonas viridiflava]|uniref:YkvA family protein n=1 Tax=Pseudomonas viridiflava TaxID=33069 RepID=UPI000F04D386|nr:YkvA family protein [Pseudomonas viridiflava]
MISNTVKQLKLWARRLKANLILLWLCCRQPDMPWLPKVIAMVTVAYAISPIDLIPDFIPVLGFLDDVLLLPLGIALALRLIPDALQQSCRPEAQALAGQRISLNGRWLMAACIVLIWLLIAWALWRAFAA